MFIILRHGQDSDNAQGILNGHRDLPLTELGEAQVQATAKHLYQKSIDIDFIISSPLQRAKRSAQIVADYLNISNLIVNPKLIERNFRYLTGKPIVEIPYYANSILTVNEINYFLEGPGVETFPYLLRRAQQVIYDLQAKYSNSNLLVVTHGDIAKMLQAAYYGWDWEYGLRATSLAQASLLYLQHDIT